MDYLFTTDHLVATLTAVIVAVLLFLAMAGMQLKSRNVIVFISILFYLFEVLKQVYWIWTGAFSLERLPLHPCNMPLYILPFSLFGNDAQRTFLTPSLYLILITGGWVTLAYPAIILGSGSPEIPGGVLGLENAWPFLNIVAHGVMLGVALYLVVSGYYQIREKDMIRVLCAYLFVFSFVHGFNRIFDTDFFFSNRGGGLPVIFDTIRNNSEFLFTLSLFSAGFLILGLSFGVTWVTTKCMQRRLLNHTFRKAQSA
jgi:hypothetical protein